MAEGTIDVEDLIDDVHRVCGDTAYSKAESLAAYEEVVAVAAVSAVALREEIAAEVAAGDEDEEDDDDVVSG